MKIIIISCPPLLGPGPSSPRSLPFGVMLPMEDSASTSNHQPLHKYAIVPSSSDHYLGNVSSAMRLEGWRLYFVMLDVSNAAETLIYFRYTGTFIEIPWECNVCGSCACAMPPLLPTQYRPRRLFSTMSEHGRIKVFAVLVALFFVAKDSGGLYLLRQKLNEACRCYRRRTESDSATVNSSQ